MYDEILLPTDGSESSRLAVAHAADLAVRHDATVHLLSVADSRNRFESPSSGVAPDVWDETQREEAQIAVGEATAELPNEVETETHIESGVPRTEILAAIDRLPVDLVVMGTHGRTGLDHYLIGSVAERIVRNSPVPVLTVRLNEE
jgi:nucleotide-binding universal stress UspA family protein